MSLGLIANTYAMAYSRTNPFEATGGMPPYTYSVVPGGAGGSITTDGLYTSPNVTGVDVVQVVDSTSAMAQKTVAVGTPLHLLCDIIQTQMGLANGRVYLWDQKIFEPTDFNLFIAVAMLNPKPFANTNSVANGQQVQSVNIKGTVTIDVISRGLDAYNRKEEAIMALRSTYSQSQQEFNSFYIAPLSTQFINLSHLDGAAIPYRYQASVAIQYFNQITTAVPYYDSFQTTTISTNS